MAWALPLHSDAPPSLLYRHSSSHFCRLPQRLSPPSYRYLSFYSTPFSKFSPSLALKPRFLAFASSEDTDLLRPSPDQWQLNQYADAEDEEDAELVRQIQRVLDLLKRNRDMLFNEVKLTIMIEDPREAERKRLLGIEASNDVTRDDLAAALEEVNEGRIPENRTALRMLAEEMINWPNLEVEVTKSKRSKSLYARATDTGIDPKEAAKRLNINWDSAAEIEVDDENSDEVVPPAVGYGALYLVTALPLIIGVSVVLILFYNSLQ